MKPLQWVKIPNRATKATVWEDVVEEAYTRPTDEQKVLDEEGLLELFKKEEPVPQTVPNPKKDVAMKKVTKTLIDSRRAQNIAIMLGGVRLPYAKIRRAIVEMDEAVLSIDRLQALRLWAPTVEECDLVHGYDGDFEELGNAERYIREVMHIPRLCHRLEHMLFRKRFEEEVEEVVPDMETVLLACEQVRNSKRLRTLLKQVLVLGNYLNGTSFRGEAHGFKLDALLNLRDTRANRESTRLLPTLLHYLVMKLEQTEPELIDFLREMPRAEVAARVCIPALLASVKELRRGVDAAAAELLELQKLDQLSDDDRFVSVMTPFNAKASMRVSGLEYQAAVAEKNLNELIAFFGDDPKDRADSPEDFFAVFTSFSTALHQARIENETARRQAQQKEMHAQRIAAMRAKKKNSEAETSIDADQQNTLSSINSQQTSFADLRETLLRSVHGGDIDGPEYPATDYQALSASKQFSRENAPHGTFLALVGASEEDILRLKPVDGEKPFFQRGTVRRSTPKDLYLGGTQGGTQEDLDENSFEEYDDYNPTYSDVGFLMDDSAEDSPSTSLQRADGAPTAATYELPQIPRFQVVDADGITASDAPLEEERVQLENTIDPTPIVHPAIIRMSTPPPALHHASTFDDGGLVRSEDGDDDEGTGNLDLGGGLTEPARLMKTGSLLKARVTLKKKMMASNRKPSTMHLADLNAGPDSSVPDVDSGADVLHNDQVTAPSQSASSNATVEIFPSMSDGPSSHGSEESGRDLSMPSAAVCKETSPSLVAIETAESVNDRKATH
ncbi:hypothetical protein DFJ77DRAFT_445848 [Powellomyces hirtus]|nr:hypothetical protein DFJ77DRAFT_445848 [Powellomyces hirtus]